MTALALSLPGGGSRSLASAKRLAAARQQGIPEPDYGAAVSQRLVEAVHRGDSPAAEECLADPAVDVNHAGAVCLQTRRVAVALREEAAHEIRVEYEELRTDVSGLFVAAHAGDLPLVRRLLVRSLPSTLRRSVFFIDRVRIEKSRLSTHPFSEDNKAACKLFRSLPVSPN